MMNYVMLNSFQHLIKNISETLNQVQGDDKPFMIVKNIK